MIVLCINVLFNNATVRQNLHKIIVYRGVVTSSLVSESNIYDVEN